MQIDFVDSPVSYEPLLKTLIMKAIYLILIVVHALIHFMGASKGLFGKAPEALQLPISKQWGFVWLIAAVLLLFYALLKVVDSSWAWTVGLAGLVVSQIVIVSFWSDAKFGTVANVILLIVLLQEMGQWRFNQVVNAELTEVVSNAKIEENAAHEPRQLEDLPTPVQRWLRRSGALNQSPIRRARISQSAEMKMKPEDSDWLKATARQVSVVNPPAFIWTVDAEMNRVLGFSGRDKFVDGKGEMWILLNGLIPVVKADGAQLDEGSLQRFLGELVWMPSLARSRYLDWKHINDTTAVAHMHYKGSSGSGTFTFNEAGDFVRYTAMRFQGADETAQRFEWVLEVQAYATFEGIKVPSEMTATWKLPEGDWTWLRLTVNDIAYDFEGGTSHPTLLR